VKLLRRQEDIYLSMASFVELSPLLFLSLVDWSCARGAEGVELEDTAVLRRASVTDVGLMPLESGKLLRELEGGAGLEGFGDKEDPFGCFVV
jgi:hypothetical protein